MLVLPLGLPLYNYLHVLKYLVHKIQRNAKTIININKAKPSLITMYGWKGTVSLDGFFISIPTGLLLPGTCKAHICKTTKPKIKNGIK